MSLNWRGFVTAWRCICILSIPGEGLRLGAPDAPVQAAAESGDSMGDTVPWFPVVGVVFALVSWALAHFLRLAWLNNGACQDPVRTALIYLLIGVIVSAVNLYLMRGFHLDGLADMFDGFGGGWDKERALAIMKDSHVGAFGSMAIVCALAWRSVCLAALLAAGGEWCLLFIPVLSRLCMSGQAAFNVYARDRGTAADVVSSSTGAHFWWGACLSALIIIPQGVWLPGELLVKVALGGALASVVVGLRSRRKIGGVTGDILGATCEAAELVMLAVAAWLV